MQAEERSRAERRRSSIEIIEKLIEKERLSVLRIAQSRDPTLAMGLHIERDERTGDILVDAIYYEQVDSPNPDQTAARIRESGHRYMERVDLIVSMLAALPDEDLRRFQHMLR